MILSDHFETAPSVITVYLSVQLRTAIGAEVARILTQFSAAVGAVRSLSRLFTTGASACSAEDTSIATMAPLTGPG